MAKVLVIDDNEGILEALEALLASEGHEVVTLMDGHKVLSTLEQKPLPDIILLDVLLSGADGRVICREIKNRAAIAHIPVIMVSAHPSAQESIFHCGADDFVAKPFSMSTLINKIESLT